MYNLFVGSIFFYFILQSKKLSKQLYFFIPEQFIMPNTIELQAMKIEFERKLDELVKSRNSFRISTVEKYQKIIKEVEEAREQPKKSSTDYRRLKRYQVIHVGNSKRLIKPITTADPGVKHYLCDDELFDVIHQAHFKSHHGGRDKIKRALKDKYANVTKDVICIYLKLCAICEKGHSLIDFIEDRN